MSDEAERQLASSRRFAKPPKTAERADYFERLTNLQQPEYLWIGCPDGRVPANVITGLEPGEVFVHRNVANLIHATDLNMLSVVEFAVYQLNVKHIIVCGHYGCGGKKFGLIEHWLQPVRDVAKTGFSSLKNGAWTEAELDHLCEALVVSQVQRLANTPTLQATWEAGKDVSIQGWVYGLKDGLLTNLNCTIKG